MRSLHTVGMIIVACMPSVASAAGLVLLTEEYPPFNMQENGKITGLSTDVVQEMMKRAKVPVTIEVLPWIRAFNRTVIEADTCVYSTTRTESREHQFKWIGPLVENPWVLYSRSDSKHTLYGLDELRPYKVGGYSGDAVSQYLIDRGFDVDLASTDLQNMRKLAAGRIDYWATGKYLGAWLVSHEKVNNLKVVLTFNTTFMYLACHVAMPDARVHDLNEILRGMQKDGTLARITARYITHKE